ncbi:MAG TPA: helix-turn-helix domain-containing protein [Mucilaginibacter sp.]
MTAQSAFTLINPVTKALAFEIFDFEDNAYFREVKPHSYYTILLVTEGIGELKADFSSYDIHENALMCFSVYQPFTIVSENLKGVLIHFHPDFFCIHKHQEEVACNGVLFNNIYESPITQLNVQELETLVFLIDQLRSEIQHAGLAQYEVMVSYLKILLINASRYKVARKPLFELKDKNEPFILRTLKEAIEEHYRTKHRPADYAELLNISTKALNKLTTIHFNRTLSDLIAERIIIEAKRELYLTTKPVKAIAYELGFNDEFYFSRFFKANAQVSPHIYRTTVGTGKANA